MPLYPAHAQLHPTNPKLLMCMNQTLALGVLSVSRFPNGHTYFVQRLHEVQRVTTLAVHPTYNCECVCAPQRSLLLFAHFCVGGNRETGPCTSAVEGGGAAHTRWSAGRASSLSRSTTSAFQSPLPAQSAAFTCSHGLCVPTCAVGGNWGKKERLRDAMLFDDPPSHWTGARKDACMCACMFGHRPSAHPEPWQSRTTGCRHGGGDACAGDSFIMVNVPKTPSMMGMQFEREFNASQASALPAAPARFALGVTPGAAGNRVDRARPLCLW